MYKRQVLIYDHHKEKKSALQGMIIGTIVCTLAAVISNVYMIIPFYACLLYTSTAINHMVNKLVVGIVSAGLLMASSLLCTTQMTPKEMCIRDSYQHRLSVM